MNPELPPPFKPGKEKEEKEEKKGGLPLFGNKAPSTSGKPVLRVRGSGGAGTILERLKQFKKKDLAFILSGLGVLFLAPLAEHFIVGPGDEKVIRPGFDSKGNMFSDAAAGYENGTGGFAPGGLPGQSSDVITPLNVRDPSALIMGMGGTQQPAVGAPAAGGVTPPSASPKSSESSWNDVVKDAARSAGGKVREAAGPAGPKGSLAGAIRGLSALSGMSYGGGPTSGMAPISANNVPNRPAEGHNLSNVAAAPGYRGVASRGMSQGQNTMEALKQAGGAQAGLFNKGGSAGQDLENAANQAINPGGGQSNGGTGPGGSAGGGGNGSANSGKDSKSIGESLEFMRQKMEMEKQVELEWKKKDWVEFDRPKEIQETLIKSFLDNIVGIGLFQPLGLWSRNAIQSFLPQAGGGGIICVNQNGAQVMRNMPTVVFKCFGSTAQGVDPNTGMPSGMPLNCSVGCYPLAGGSAAGGGQQQQPPNGQTPAGVPVTSPAQSTIQVGQGFAAAQGQCGSAVGDLKQRLAGCAGPQVDAQLCPQLQQVSGAVDTLQQGCDAMGTGQQSSAKLAAAQADLHSAKLFLQGAMNALGTNQNGASSGGQGQTAYSLLDSIRQEGGLAATALKNGGTPLAPDAVANVGTSGDLGKALKYYGQLANPETSNSDLKTVQNGQGKPTDPQNQQGPLLTARADLYQASQALISANNNLQAASTLLSSAQSALTTAASAAAGIPQGAGNFTTLTQSIQAGNQDAQALQQQINQANQVLTNAQTANANSAVPAFGGQGGGQGQDAVDAYRSSTGQDVLDADGNPATAKAIAGFDVSDKSAIYKAASDYQAAQTASDQTKMDSAQQAYNGEVAKLQNGVNQFGDPVLKGVNAAVGNANTAVGQIQDPALPPGAAPQAQPGAPSSSPTGQSTQAPAVPAQTTSGGVNSQAAPLFQGLFHMNGQANQAYINAYANGYAPAAPATPSGGSSGGN